MRFLRRALIHAQIEIAGRNQPVVAQDLLNMPDRAPIEKERRRYRMPEHVCGHGLGKADRGTEASEPGVRSFALESIALPSHDEERLTPILAPEHVFLHPIQRAWAEKD